MAAYGAGAAPGLFATAGTGSLGAGLGSAAGYWGAGSLAGSMAYGGLGSMGGGAAAGGGSALQQAQDWYNSLPKYQQSALRGAGQNFVTSGGDPKAALQGGLTGGIGGLAGGALNSFGAPSWLSSLGGNLAGKLAGGLSAGALGGGGAGGGSPSAGGAQSASGGVGMGAGVSGAGSSAGGGAGGLSGGWRLPSAALQAEQTYLNKSYAPIALDTARKKLTDQLGDQLSGLA